MDFSRAYENEPRRFVFCMDAKSFMHRLSAVSEALTL